MQWRRFTVSYNTVSVLEYLPRQKISLQLMNRLSKSEKETGTKASAAKIEKWKQLPSAIRQRRSEIRFRTTLTGWLSLEKSWGIMALQHWLGVWSRPSWRLSCSSKLCLTINCKEISKQSGSFHENSILSTRVKPANLLNGALINVQIILTCFS